MSMDHLKSSGLYVHIPFCKTKCPYCDFYSITSPELISAYLSALEKEAQIYHAKVPANGGTGVSPVPAQAKTCGYNDTSLVATWRKNPFTSFDSLYLGGGTPSLLDGPQLSNLVACLRRHFAFAPDTEFTIEANPDDVTPEKLRLWRDLGVNRLSLGVQSFDDQELAFLGRRHTARQAEQALNCSRAAGFTNLGVDLIYGLPGQRAEVWKKNLARALEFRPENLSCYQLTLEAGTPLGARQAQGQIKPLPEETERDLFLLTSRFLTEQGYIHYEISNFARGETYYSRHNRKYWRHAPYLGLGPAAHSFTEGKRWWNHRSLEQYCRALREGVTPVADSETLTAAQLHLESLYLGLRTQEGVALDLIRPQPRGDLMLGELQKAGLVKVRHGRAAPTREGFLVADRLPLWFAE